MWQINKANLSFVTLLLVILNAVSMYLQIRDGGSFEATPVGLFCGSDLPSQITSTGNLLRIEFHSDYSVGGSGFSMEWQAVPPSPVNPTAPGPTIDTGI
jgi:hypothetical protein